MRTRLVTASVVVFLCALTGCASGGPMSDPYAPRPSSSPVSSPAPSSAAGTRGPIGPTGTPTDVPADRWAAIQDDLKKRGVDGTPELVSAEAVTFTDGSLGCPSPGQSYTQALVDGMRVVVSVDGRQYDYRFGEGGGPRLCTR